MEMTWTQRFYSQFKNIGSFEISMKCTMEAQVGSRSIINSHILTYIEVAMFKVHIGESQLTTKWQS